MIWILTSVIFILLSWWALAVNNKKLNPIFSLAAFSLLLIWLASQVDLFELGKDEESLILWFAIALLIIILEKVLRILTVPSSWIFILSTASAYFYALGLDVFRPDAYAFLPASIIALLVFGVALRAMSRLLRSGKTLNKTDQALVVVSSLVFSLQLYASFYKLLDRGWLLPWSYLVALGTLLFVLSQLWRAWKKFGLGGNTWQARIIISHDLAQYLLVASAYFHYSKYL